MASTLNSDNGVVSGSAGLKSSADSSGVLALQTNGTTAVTVDTSQNVGIGVTPSAWGSTNGGAIQFGSGYSSLYSYSNAVTLGSNVYYNAGNKYFASGVGSSVYQQVGGAHYWSIAPSGTAGNAISFTQAMTLDASGNLGVGTTSPTTTLTLVGSDATGKDYLAIRNDYANNAGKYAGMIFQGRDSAGTAHGVKDGGAIRVFGDDADWGGANMRFYSRTADTLTERARIDSSGNLLVGCTNGDPYRFRASTNSGTTTWQFGPYSTVPTNYYVVNQAGTGVYITSGNTSWSTVSDERFKDIIEPITNAVDKLSALRTVIGKYKTDEEGTRRSFLIAQDVQAVFPEAVNASNPDELAVQYTETIPLLVAAIKEQQALIATQSELITQLQADVAALKA